MVNINVETPWRGDGLDPIVSLEVEAESYVSDLKAKVSAAAEGGPENLTLVYLNEAGEMVELKDEATVGEYELAEGTTLQADERAESPEVVSPPPERRKVVLTVKKDIPEEYRAREKRNLTLARKINAGESIALYGQDATVTMPEAHKDYVPAVPQTLATTVPSQQTASLRGNLPSRRVLGSVESYLQRKKNSQSHETVVEESSEVQLLETVQSHLGNQVGEEETNLVLEEYKRKLSEQASLAKQLGIVSKCRAKERQERMSKLKKMRVFERTVELKEERALKRWEQINKEWLRFEARVCKNFGKNVDELVMNRAEIFREKWEEYDLLQRAVPISEKNSDSQWEMSLRGGVQRFIQCGPAFFGLFCPVRDESTQPVQIIRKPGVQTMDKLERQGTIQVKTWKDNPMLLQKQRKLSKRVESLVEHRPEMEDLQVIGNKILDISELERSAEDEISVDQIAEKVHFDLTQTARSDGLNDLEAVSEEETIEEHQGPLIGFSASHLSFQTKAGEWQADTCQLFNRGTTAIYYQWTKEEKENKLGLKQQCDGVQRFYMGDFKGSILPEESKTFSFTFKSEKPGVFTEKWKLTTIPSTTAPAHYITLRGVSIREDVNRIERLKLEDHIERNIKLHSVQDIVYDIVDSVKTPRVEPTVRDMTEDTNEEMFNMQNQGLTLFYSSEVYAEFERLAERTFVILEFPEEESRWDSSVASLEELIAQVEDDDMRENLSSRFLEIMKRGSVPAYHGSALLYSIGYELLIELAEDVCGASDVLRRQHQLPDRIFVAPKDEELEEDEDPKNKKKGDKKKEDKKPAKGKKGKKDAVEEEEVPLDSRENWDEERLAQENVYRAALEVEVAEMIDTTMERFDLLCAEGEKRSMVLASMMIKADHDNLSTMHSVADEDEEPPPL